MGNDDSDSSEYEDDFEEEEEVGCNMETEVTWKSIKFCHIEVAERIGGGGVGIIYKGYYQNEAVALKTLFDPRVNEDLKQEYIDELLVMSKLRHANIVHCIGACLEPPNLCIVMELAECSLYDIIHRSQDQNHLKAKTIVGYGIDIARAMSYLHEQRPAIIHRDLKPQNILLGYDGKLKLCDFGLVRTKASTAGTPMYMPPELLLGASFSKSVDVYMFAMVFWEMFACAIPFDGFDVSDIKSKVTRGERPKIPKLDCPSECQDIISKCWQSDPSARLDFSEILETLLHVYNSIRDRSEVESLNALGDSLDCIM